MRKQRLYLSLVHAVRQQNTYEKVTQTKLVKSLVNPCGDFKDPSHRINPTSGVQAVMFTCATDFGSLLSWQLTNQSRLGVWGGGAVKRAGAAAEHFSVEGGAAASHSKISKSFLNIKACKHVLKGATTTTTT